jgi:hypothetical protein
MLTENSASLPSSQNLFKVYPNPTSGAFTLELTGGLSSSPVQMDLFGTIGEHELTSLLTGQPNYGFSLSGKPAGIYTIRLVSGNRSEILKIIKQ